ncbi:MAG: phosphatidylserine decarboxylase [Pseudomonadales bacterium]|nr:phosphatidylserine decarboxylase [Pseudomonadales bacterium]
MKDALFIFLQHIVPQHLLSRLTGKLADCEIPAIKNFLIDTFIKQFDVSLDQAVEKEAHNYASFNAFFTRELEPGARPICSKKNGIACPADGAISQIGDIANGCIFQAKGKTFSCQELLGGDEKLSADFEHGSFATIYLSPRDYHRVHMPIDGKLLSTHYIPGQLFSVNTTTANNVNRLFSRNERLVCIFETDVGKMALVLVGAMIVAGIETVWAGQIAPPPRTVTTTLYENVGGISLAKGSELGRFKLGSTVIMLFQEQACSWLENFEEGKTTRMGELLGSVNPEAANAF